MCLLRQKERSEIGRADSMRQYRILEVCSIIGTDVSLVYDLFRRRHSQSNSQRFEHPHLEVDRHRSLQWVRALDHRDGQSSGPADKVEYGRGVNEDDHTLLYRRISRTRVEKASSTLIRCLAEVSINLQLKCLARSRPSGANKSSTM
jgi:hypothetical protein